MEILEGIFETLVSKIIGAILAIAFIVVITLTTYEKNQTVNKEITILRIENDTIIVKESNEFVFYSIDSDEIVKTKLLLSQGVQNYCVKVNKHHQISRIVEQQKCKLL
jgi:L-cysteine desulfidase